MKKIRVNRIGFFWYRDAEQYAQYLEIFEDVDELHRTFPQWHKNALKLLEKVERQGFATTKIYSTPQEFKAWCMANGAALNGRSRSEFARIKAESEATGHMNLLDAIHSANQRD